MAQVIGGNERIYILHYRMDGEPGEPVRILARSAGEADAELMRYLDNEAVATGSPRGRVDIVSLSELDLTRLPV